MIPKPSGIQIAKKTDRIPVRNKSKNHNNEEAHKSES